MWKKLVDWYRGWDEEQLRILDEPEFAQTLAPGYRRYLGSKLAELSLVERRQLKRFSLKYRGWRLYAAIAKMLVLFSLAGVALHLAYPAPGLMKSLALTNAVGSAIMFCYLGALFNYRKVASHRWKVFFSVIAWSTLGGAFGLGLGAIERGESFAHVLDNDQLPFMLGTMVAIGVLFVVPMTVVGWLRNRQYLILTAQLEHTAERERLARELSESHLRLLRAQIEPHFLFNTLGAVQQLAEQGAPRAAALTANLIAFLRASLAEMRSEQVTLQTDFGLIASYLQVMQTRMGDRLRYQLALPDALAKVNVPAMLLLTLVENAIKHGIEPALRGGEVQVTAQQQDDLICLRVRDSGVGMSLTPGAGDGLENVRTRLQLTYGGAASLLLHEGEEGGVIAEIRLPAVQGQRQEQGQA